MRRFLVRAALLALPALVALALLVRGLFEVAALALAPSLPDVVDRKQFDSEIWQMSRVTDRRGLVVAEYYRERRTVVAVAGLPEHLLQAVMAAEDKGFYDHNGIDWLATARMLAVNTVRGRLVQGASTITQQLARNLYLSAERSVRRKVREALMARKIERAMTKDEILHQYLNLIYWGHGRYGIEEAARYYFGKGAKQLELAESAMLAGIIKGPEHFSPRRFPERAAARFDYVLRQMVAAGFLAADAPLPAPPRLAPLPEEAVGTAPYAVDTALVELARHLPDRRLDSSGLRLVTTIDSGRQAALERAVAASLPRLRVTVRSAAKPPADLPACAEGGTIPTGCAVWAQVAGRNREDDGYLVELLGRVGIVPDDSLDELVAGLAAGDWLQVMPDISFSYWDLWLTEEVRLVPVVVPQVAAVLLRAESGAVEAVYGGIDHRYHPFNRVVSARRPVASTFKPFVYLAALEMLAWSSATQVDSRPLDLTGADGTPWRVRDLHPEGPHLTLARALADSSNCAAVRTLRELGVANFLAAWERWGLPPPTAADLSLALGSTTMTPLELASAYALIANGRCPPEPHILTALTTPAGPVKLPAPTCTGSAAPEELAELRDLLAAVVTDGTGKAAAVAGVDTWGKTGTSREGRDGWFAGGFKLDDGHPRVLIVWVGTDDNSPLPNNSGPETAAPLWSQIVHQLARR